jgi:glutamine synthetase
MNFIPDEVMELNLDNAAVKPMPGTLYSLPWAADGKHRVGEVLCEMFWIPPYRDGSPQTVCPRYVARRQLNRLAELGYRLYSGYEAEFILCDAGGKPVFKGVDMNVNTVYSEFESFLYDMDEKMETAGIDVATFQTEYGDGQFELAMTPKYDIESADQLFKLKHAVKEMSRQRDNWQAAFMSKPFTDTSGNGLHFSHSLWSTDEDCATRNVFHDPQSNDSLSAVARHWLAGLLIHSPAIMALCSPTVNCYRRLGTTFTPTYVDWGFGYRSAMIRVKAKHPKNTYVENRIAAGSANPYLVMAATVAAGIDGIVNKLECPPPMTINQRAAEEKAHTSKTQKLPHSLSESLDALENDDALCEALGREFVAWFVNSKRANEIAKVAQAVKLGQKEMDVERELYFKLF